MGEVTIEIKESAASKPFIEVFEEDQKLWEVFKFVETHLGDGAMLWDIKSQEIYTTGSKAMKKSLVDLGLTGHVTFMGVRKERIPRVPMRIGPIRGGGRGGGGSGSSSYEEEGPSLEERKAKAKQYLEEKREAAKAMATEAEKEKEKERRRIGQELMKEKIKKEKEEMKKVSESISQRKAAKKAELAKIRAEIERDKEMRKKEREGSSTTPAPAPAKPATPPVRVSDGKVKMKVRVANSTILRTFEETDLLSAVVDYVKQETQQDVTLSNTYPRKEYKKEDLDKSLVSLGLTGSVCLVGKTTAVVKSENTSDSSKGTDTN